MIRKFISATIAPGGIGKSSLLIVETLAMVTGRALLGDKQPEPLRVLYWNGEDPKDELDRRIAGACIQYGISSRDIGDRLFVNSGRDSPIVIATETKSGVAICEPIISALKETISGNRLDVVIVDPFVASHDVSENDNSRINAVARVWAGIADECGCAIELVHHVRKAGSVQGAYTTDDARGAGALINATRSARIINPMSDKEAKEAGVTEPWRYFRVTTGKANLAPAGDACWRQIKSVDIGNGSQEYPPDQVGVVTSWQWTNPADELDVFQVREIEQRIGAGKYRESAQAVDWVGLAVAGVLGLDAERDKARIKRLIRNLIDRGTLLVVEDRDVKGMPRKYIEVAHSTP